MELIPAQTVFRLTITQVNDPPSFGLLTNLLVIGKNAGSVAFSNIVASYSVGPSNEVDAGQTIKSYTVIPSSNTFFLTTPAMATNGLLTFAVKSNYTGFTILKLYSTDTGGTSTGGRDISDTNLIYLAVTNINSAPVIASVTDKTIYEDAATNISVSVTDADTTNVTVSASSSSNGLVKVSIQGVGTTRTITLTPALNAYGGPAVITLVAYDGTYKITNTFNVTVQSVNDAPSFTTITNMVVVAEDASACILSNFVANISTGPANETSQTFTVSCIPTGTNFFLVAPAVDTNGDLSFTTATNVCGSNIVKIVIRDDGGTSFGGVDASTNTITIVVTNINDAPLIGNLTNLAILENAKPTNYLFSIGDVDTALSQVAVTVVSSDTGLVGVANSGISSNRTITFSPVTNAFGTSTITLVASDGFSSSTNSFILTVTHSNVAARVMVITNLSILENSVSNKVAITLYDPDTDMTNITVTAGSKDTNLVAASGLSIVGIDSNRVLFITPATNVIGTNYIYLVSDDGTNTFTNTIRTVITAVNQAPSITLITNSFTLGEDSGLVFLTLSTNYSVGPANESKQKLSFNVLCTNASFFKIKPAVTNGVLSFAMATNLFDTFTVQFYVGDDGGTNNGGVNVSATNLISIAVTNVDDAPVVTISTNLSMLENGVTNVPFIYSDIDSSNVTFTISSSASNLVTAAVGGTAYKYVTLTGATNANGGPATIALVADDGTLKKTNTIAVTVWPVNQTPSFVIENGVLTIMEDAGAQTVSNFVSSISVGPLNESSQIYSFITQASSPTNFFSVQPVVDINGTLTYTVATNQYGTNIVAIKMVDSGSTSNKGVNTATNLFRIVASNINDAPVIAAITDRALKEDFGKTNISISVTDVDTPIGNVSVTASTTNTDLIAVSVSGTTTNRIVTLTSITNANGTAFIKLVANDGQSASTNVFAVTMTAQNDAPAISMLYNLTINEDALVTNILFKLADVDSPLSSVITTASISDASLADVTITNKDLTNRVLIIAPKTNANGSAVVSVIADDGQAKTTNTFKLAINPVNDPPVFSISTNMITVGEDAGPVNIANYLYGISGGPANESMQKVSFVVFSSNSNIFAIKPTISPAGALSFKTATNQIGTATLSFYGSG